MFISGIIAAAAAAKWLVAAGIMTAVGTCCMVIDPAVERMKEKNSEKSE
jgi:hypothetical protein